MSADLIEAGAPRCGECGMPLVMHHDPGCAQPCGACLRARNRRLIRYFLLSALFGQGVVAAFLGGLAAGQGHGWGSWLFLAGMAAAVAAWLLVTRLAGWKP